MITGDNYLTACKVARDLGITEEAAVVLQKNEESGLLGWASIDGKWESESVERPPASAALCVSGPMWPEFIRLKNWKSLLPRIKVFARVSPDQKESIVIALKSLNKITLMCGDGTNDVGALKQAHVGVALLNSPEQADALTKALRPRSAASPADSLAAADREGLKNRRSGTKTTPAAASNPRPGKTMADLMKELEEADKPLVQLGDASIASPFTAKTSSVQAVIHIIRQGRCTLVTTQQMFQILALNCLITAYSLSVLYLDGVKLGDT
jgi:cation-transporting ATPase 13A1